MNLDVCFAATIFGGNAQAAPCNNLQYIAELIQGSLSILNQFLNIADGIRLYLGIVFSGLERIFALLQVCLYDAHIDVDNNTGNRRVAGERIAEL